jgi:hypothetical protein
MTPSMSKTSPKSGCRSATSGDVCKETKS